MNHDFLKKEFLSKYLSLGRDKFYKSLLFYAIKKILSSQQQEDAISANLELLEYYDQFIILYRRDGDQNYLEVAKLLRKAAHKIYRIMLKKNLTPRNDKFLNLV